VGVVGVALLLVLDCVVKLVRKGRSESIEETTEQKEAKKSRSQTHKNTH